MSTDSSPPFDPLEALVGDAEVRANNFDDHHRRIYEGLLAEILADLEARPGFASLHRMLAERASHTFVLLKLRDAMPGAERANWQDYERINKIFFGAVDRLFAEAKLGDMDMPAKVQLTRTIMRGALDVVDRLPLDEEAKSQAVRELQSHVAEHVA